MWLVLGVAIKGTFFSEERAASLLVLFDIVVVAVRELITALSCVLKPLNEIMMTLYYYTFIYFFHGLFTKSVY